MPTPKKQENHQTMPPQVIIQELLCNLLSTYIEHAIHQFDLDYFLLLYTRLIRSTNKEEKKNKQIWKVLRTRVLHADVP